MSNDNVESLQLLLDDATKKLSKVSWRRMFGCDAVFADKTIFGLVWKKGRIGLKLPEAAGFKTLMDAAGSAPWKAGPMTMAHWVLVPESFHSDRKNLAAWVRRAHGLALLNPKPAKAKKK